MSFLRTLQHWEYLAKKDPYWAILSVPSKKNGGWDLDEFFASGQVEIDRTFKHLERIGALPADFASALDFGCGVGRLSRALGGRFERVFGVDAAPTMIDRARQLNAGRRGLEFVLNQEPRLGRFADGSISFVYSALVLQHITYPESLGYVGELLRVLAPGGVAVLQTPTLDRTPLPMRLARSVTRQVVRRAHLPFDGFYIDMNTIPVRQFERVAAERGCDIVDRMNVNRAELADDGSVVARRAPWFERLVSERFVVRKRR